MKKNRWWPDAGYKSRLFKLALLSAFLLGLLLIQAAFIYPGFDLNCGAGGCSTSASVRNDAYNGDGCYAYAHLGVRDDAYSSSGFYESAGCDAGFLP